MLEPTAYTYAPLGGPRISVSLEPSPGFTVAGAGRTANASGYTTATDAADAALHTASALGMFRDSTDAARAAAALATVFGGMQ